MFAQTIFTLGVVLFSTTPNVKIVWANILKLSRGTDTISVCVIVSVVGGILNCTPQTIFKKRKTSHLLRMKLKLRYIDMFRIWIHYDIQTFIFYFTPDFYPNKTGTLQKVFTSAMPVATSYRARSRDFGKETGTRATSWKDSCCVDRNLHLKAVKQHGGQCSKSVRKKELILWKLSLYDARS